MRVVAEIEHAKGIWLTHHYNCVYSRCEDGGGQQLVLLIVPAIAIVLVICLCVAYDPDAFPPMMPTLLCQWSMI